MTLSKESVNRAVRTFVFAFAGIALPGFLGFLNDVTAWANDGGQRAFPDAKNLSFLGVSALCAGLVAALNLAVNAIEDSTGKAFLRPVQPKPPKNQAGDATLILLVVICVVVLLLIFGVHFGH